MKYLTGFLVGVLLQSLLLFGILYFDTPVEAQTRIGGNAYTATVQNVTGATAARIQRVPSWNHSVYLLVTGAPTGCTYRLQGSNDGTNWFDMGAADITCTTSIVTFLTNQGAARIRGNLKTLSGGSSPTVTMKYIGD